MYALTESVVPSLGKRSLCLLPHNCVAEIIGLPVCGFIGLTHEQGMQAVASLFSRLLTRS